MQPQYDEMASGIWKAERRIRITSSMAGTIAKRRATTQVTSTLHNMLYTKFSGNEATRWGLSQERATASQYIQWKQQHGSPEISVDTECGLVISVPILGWLQTQMILSMIPKVHLPRDWWNSRIPTVSVTLP